MPDAVTIDDVRHMAALARLGLTDERARILTSDLNTILAHMQELAAVDTSGVPEATAAGQTAMRLRDDTGGSAPLAEPPESFAPRMQDGFFIVPRVSSHEDPESAS